MTAPGLRERKKMRTRYALLFAAMRLFEEKGYAQTTVAEIAAAADVSTKTLFNYYSGKEDIVFGGSEFGVEELLRQIRSGRPGETLGALLERVTLPMQAEFTPDEADQIRRTKIRLIKEIPELQARSMRILFDLQRQMIDALTELRPELDPIVAAAAVGATIGALHTTAWFSIERGDKDADIRAATTLALKVSNAGIDSVRL